MKTKYNHQGLKNKEGPRFRSSRETPGNHGSGPTTETNEEAESPLLVLEQERKVCSNKDVQETVHGAPGTLPGGQRHINRYTASTRLTRGLPSVTSGQSPEKVLITAAGIRRNSNDPRGCL